MKFITLLGLCAAMCTTAAFIPQVVQIIKTKHTHDISLGMYILFTIGVTAWLMYGILQHDEPIIFANVITLGLALTVLFYKIKYK